MFELSYFNFRQRTYNKLPQPQKNQQKITKQNLQQQQKQYIPPINKQSCYSMCAYRDKQVKKQQSYHSTLRSSSQFLNLLMLRNTLSNTYCPSKVRNLNQSMQLRRFSNLNTLRLNTNPNSNINTSHEDSKHNEKTYLKLKNTLDTLQTKIDKAQQILSSPYKKKRSKHNIQFDIQITLSDMDQKTTKKNQQSTSKFMHNQQKISQIEMSKNSSITTCKQLNKNKGNNNNISQCGVRYNKQYYISSLLNINSHKIDPRVQQHIKLNFEVIKKLNHCQALDHKQLSNYKVLLPPNKTDKKTLLLDIDDTILNCDDAKNQGENYDFQLDIEDEDGSTFPAFIRLRPYALTFLRNVSKYYEIVAYTGSIENYAKKVLEEMDPDNELFTYKLYRSSCFEIFNGVYVKDIRIVNRRPQHIVLVDNSPYSYIYQLQNGIPILPYQKGPDQQLPKLQKYLLNICKYNDIREVNKNIFKFHRYCQFENVNDMITNLYEQDGKGKH